MQQLSLAASGCVRAMPPFFPDHSTHAHHHPASLPSFYVHDERALCCRVSTAPAFTASAAILMAILRERSPPPSSRAPTPREPPLNCHTRGTCLTPTQIVKPAFPWVGEAGLERQASQCEAPPPKPSSQPSFRPSALLCVHAHWRALCKLSQLGAAYRGATGLAGREAAGRAALGRARPHTPHGARPGSASAVEWHTAGQGGHPIFS